MLKIYKTENGGKLVKLKQSKNVSQAWFSLINPSGEEIEQVSSMLKVDSDILKNSLDADERSRTEVDDGVFSAIINLPLLDEEGNFDTLPCGLVFSAKNFLTVDTAISAALSFGKRNSPVEMQQKAMLSISFCAASSRHDL